MQYHVHMFHINVKELKEKTFQKRRMESAIIIRPRGSHRLSAGLIAAPN